MNRIVLFFCILTFLSCEREKLSWDMAQIVPKLSECVVNNISATSVQLESKILTNGGSNISEYGFCISKGDTSHYIKDNMVTFTSNDWKLNITLNDLKIGTKYFVKSYAINSVGIGYSKVTSFTTKLLPVVVTDTFTNATKSSAEFWGVVLFDGGALVTERGVCISSAWNEPTIYNSSCFPSGSGEGAFTTGPVQLNSNILFYYRAYAKTENGVGYGKVKTIVLK
jgi:hypothetical protein